MLQVKPTLVVNGFFHSQKIGYFDRITKEDNKNRIHKNNNKS